MAGLSNDRGHGRRRDLSAKRLTVATALALAIGLFCGSALGFFTSLLICRRENVTPPAACPVLDDDPGLLFWVAVVTPAVAVLALAVAGGGRRTLGAAVAATIAFWGGYLASVLLT